MLKCLANVTDCSKLAGCRMFVGRRQESAEHLVVLSGKNLAVFRGEDGRAHALDAYCCHNGANLAVGGLVKGSCVECPFHGWLFRGDDGKCTHIPYCERSASRSSLASSVHVTIARRQ